MKRWKQVLGKMKKRWNLDNSFGKYLRCLVEGENGEIVFIKTNGWPLHYFPDTGICSTKALRFVIGNESNECN